MKEEVCLGVMKLIENEFKFYELKWQICIYKYIYILINQFNN